MNKVLVINYGLGNLASVMNALEFCSIDAFISDNSGDLKNASHAILPGVGAFGQGMHNLKTTGWVQAIQSFACTDKKPFLGICLGMQLLADSSTEHGDHEGLSLIPGTVDRMGAGDGVRIPHIGWNSVETPHESKTYQHIESGEDYYFVHSYAVTPKAESDVSGKTQHGQTFVASVERDNIWGVQFHPEKSHAPGLQVLKNFWESTATC